ncbi:RTA1 like protein-domain-containing protein [Chytriomyces cf. hyalinus JEL632]|nr:RTA1 like protein-domain-containing protein [Chytriomyces cf. hyalinus JEL632]
MNSSAARFDPTRHPDGTFNYEVSPFGEQPRVSLAAIAAAVYTILFAIHLIQGIRYKTFYMAAAIAGAFFEAVGYFCRIVSINDPFSIPMYSAQYSFIVVSPVLVAATQYVMLEKVMHHSYPEASPVKHTLITRTFVISDVIAFFVQVAGSSILLSDRTKTDLGLRIMMAGLVVQVISFAVYLGIAVIFYKRAKILAQGGKAALVDRQAWRTIFMTLMASGMMVFLRSVFRIIEFSYGFRGFIATNEVYMYVFDFGLMMLALLAFNVNHPGAFLRASHEFDAELK